MIKKIILCGTIILLLSTICFASGENSRNTNNELVSKQTREVNNEKNEILRQASKALNNREYELAIKYYTEYLKKYGLHPGVLLNRGNAYSELNEIDLALADYTKSIEMAPHNAIYKNRGNLLYESGRYKEAIYDYEKILQSISHESSDDIGELNIRLAVSYMSIQQYDKAEEYYRKVLDMGNSMKYYKARARAGIGDLYLMKKDGNKATAEYTLAINLNPTWSEPYYKRYMAYRFYLSDDNKALSDISRAVELAPYFPEYYYERGSLYRKMNKYNLAIEDFLVFKKAYPEREYVCKELGDLYYSINEFDNAKKEYYIFLEKCIENLELNISARADVYIQLGKILMEEKQFDEAIKCFSDAIVDYNNLHGKYKKDTDEDEDLSRCYGYRAIVYGSMDKNVDALEDYNLAIKYNPNVCELYMLRGYTYIALGDKNKALSEFYKAKSMAPDDVEIDEVIHKYQY